MADRTQLRLADLEALKADHPELPSEYFDYLLNVGSGVAESGRMIYSGPVEPTSIFGGRFQYSSVVLLGDDMQGYCFGFDKAARCLGEISESGIWQPWPATRSFSDYTREV